MEDFKEILGKLIIGIIAFIVAPFIVFWCAWIGGWVASHIVGTALCRGLNILFGTTRFIPEMIPWIAGSLGWIGCYFKKAQFKKCHEEDF